MYSWDDSTDDWKGSGSYAYGGTAEAKRLRDDAKAREHAGGPRNYVAKGGPDLAKTDPRRRFTSRSKNPLVIAVDVTGSMASWPREIFDRLPLLASTLSQYRDDLEISFAAIGDARCDRWPLQVTDFARGHELEALLSALHGEGGGGDAPESYGLFAHWLDTHVEVPEAERPFLIVFGDAPMHEEVTAGELRNVLGEGQGDRAIDAFQRVSKRWDTWFLRRPGGRAGDETHRQWAQAVGEQKILHVDEELRAVDYAMGLIARRWGAMGDFEKNLAARQDEAKVKAVTERVKKAVALLCPACSAPLPVTSARALSCAFCGATLALR